MPPLNTTVFLICPGVTDWHRDDKLLGRRDIPLNQEGKAQAEHLAQALDGIHIAEVISSPLQRALQTADVIGRRFGIETARDNRLIDFHLGAWEGKPASAILDTPEYQQFLSAPMNAAIPGGDNHEDVKRRAVAAIEQALEDNPSGAAIAIITHARVIRLLLAHYMAAPPATYHQIQLGPASLSVLQFSHDSHLARVVAVNWRGSLPPLLAGGEQAL